MKILTLIFSVIVLKVFSQNITFKDEKTLECIPQRSPDEKTLENYAKLQVVTDLTRLPLRDIARRELVPEKNGSYNAFLACSWKKYEYQTRQGVVVFDAIERVLKDALVREVGATGPGINLSKIEAKNIINQCKDIKGITHGQTAVQVQNCILKQIQHIGLIN